MAAPPNASSGARNAPSAAIAFVIVGMTCISVNDMLIKQLSGDYPLHQMVFARSAIAIVFTLALVQFEGGFGILRTDKPLLHMLRGLLVVIANMTYFAALAVLPLANASALFFVAPLFITILSIPFLGEPVGRRRIQAVLVGFAGVVVMLRPWESFGGGETHWVVLMLPVLAALAYSMMQILTRRLGIASKPSAMAVYMQGTFIAVSLVFWAVAGDGRFAEGVTDESLVFLLRAWVWPQGDDIWLFAGLGVNAAVVGYTMSAAYRSADAAVVAPFEYVLLPLAILWGWMFWGDLPGPWTLAGAALIVGAGLYVFLRERTRKVAVASRRPMRRW